MIPNPLLPLLFLASTLAATVPFTLPPTPHCYNSASTSPHAPTVYKDCIDIIKRMPEIRRDPALPLKWSADPALRPDHVLPARWQGSRNMCLVELDMPPWESGGDRSNVEDLEAAAMAVAKECVIRPPHLGGWVQVGWERKMKLQVGRVAQAGVWRTPNELESGTMESA